MNAASPGDRTGRYWLELARERSLGQPGAQLVHEHHGPMDHGSVARFVVEAEQASLRTSDALTLRKRLINVIVEALENAQRHTRPDLQNSVMALVVDTPAGYRLIVGNALPFATAALLTHRISILNEMDEADLREHYLKLLSNEGRSAAGGAGLGLLTIARRSVRPIQTRTVPLDNNSAYFSMELAIDRSA